MACGTPVIAPTVRLGARGRRRRAHGLHRRHRWSSWPTPSSGWTRSIAPTAGATSSATSPLRSMADGYETVYRRLRRAAPGGMTPTPHDDSGRRPVLHPRLRGRGRPAEARPQARRCVPRRRPARRLPEPARRASSASTWTARASCASSSCASTASARSCSTRGMSEDARAGRHRSHQPGCRRSMRRGLAAARPLAARSPGGSPCIADQLYQLAGRGELHARPARRSTSTLRFAADFVDVFEVRGPSARAARRHAAGRGSARPRRELGYRGLDDVMRDDHAGLRRRRPTGSTPTGADYRLIARRRARASSSPSRGAATSRAGARAGPTRLRRGAAAPPRRHRALDRGGAEVRTDHDLFDGVGRAVTPGPAPAAHRDRRTASSRTPASRGTWRPFGRDALITRAPGAALRAGASPRGTLRFLRAVTSAAWTTPSPIRSRARSCTSCRRGEMAACREIPFIPYYGSVDATPLFVMLLAEYLRWTADTAFARELWPTAERVLAWMLANADAHRGYLTYLRRSSRGLTNQGWKDSLDAIMHADGRAGRGAHRAGRGAGLPLRRAAGRRGHRRGRRARPSARPTSGERARRLRERFEADFWLPDEAYYALALDREGAPCRVITSNAGHLLWTRIVSDSRAPIVARRMMADDMFTGWGVRTLASGERLYNPMSYHNGSVWPHDTAIAATGMRRYGLVAALPHARHRALRGGPPVRAHADARALLRLPPRRRATARPSTRSPARRRRGRPASCSC